ncbi:hypothetical protein C0V97_10840 [Asaia sp. W19]|nr:hypothetical protein C0V97_10840 [Asaia sp. W19]
MMQVSMIPPHRMVLKTTGTCHLSSQRRLAISVPLPSKAMSHERKRIPLLSASPNATMATSGAEYGLMAAWCATANETFGRAVLRAVALLRNVREN